MVRSGAVRRPRVAMARRKPRTTPEAARPRRQRRYRQPRKMHTGATSGWSTGALWDGSDGGTGACVKYAERVGRIWVNLWDEWPGALQ